MTTSSLARPVPLTRDRARAVFGQVMGLVALTLGCLAVGAYIGRDLSRGLGILFFVGGFTCIFRLSAASEDASSFRPRVACSGWRSVPS